MKYILILIICFISINLAAQNQRPQAPISIAEVNWDSDYYEKLQNEWEVLVKKDNNDADAWRNFYMSAYYKHKSSTFYNDSILKGTKKEQEDILNRMEKAVPNSFEYNVVKYKSKQISTENGKYLLKAYELRPDDISIYIMLTVYYEMLSDVVKKEEIYKKMYANNPNIPDYKLAYAYNTLNTVEKDAIILGNGDFTITAIELLKYGKDFRKDVTVVYQSMFQSDTYYYNLLESLGMPEFKKSYIEFAKEYSKDLPKAYHEFKYSRIKHIIDNANGRPVYFPIHFERKLFNSFEDSLYMIGTMYKYSEYPFDNIALLKRNFEQKMLLDHLKVDLKIVPENSLKYSTQTHYIQPLMELYKHYVLSGDLTKKAEIKKLIMKLGNDYNPKTALGYEDFLKRVDEAYSDL